jgi:hypothetical protein
VVSICESSLGNRPQIILQAILSDRSLPDSSFRDLCHQLGREKFVFTPAATGIRLGDHWALVGTTAKWTDGGFYWAVSHVYILNPSDCLQSTDKNYIGANPDFCSAAFVSRHLAYKFHDRLHISINFMQYGLNAATRIGSSY